MRNLKCWYYQDELRSLAALVFVARLGLETMSVSTNDWRKWAEVSSIDENDFEQSRSWLEQHQFVTYYAGQYQVTAKGIKWYESLTLKRLVY